MWEGRTIIKNDSLNLDFINFSVSKIDDQILLVKAQIENCLDWKKIKVLDDQLDHLNEMKELLIPFSSLLNESAKEIYSDVLKRMPSLFVEDRNFADKLIKDVTDLYIFLDCYWKWACFDHHWVNFTEWSTETKVAASKVLDFINENDVNRKDTDSNSSKVLGTSMLLQLYELSDAAQKIDRLKKYDANKKSRDTKLSEFLNDFIPLTKWGLDTDALISHYSLLHPKDAKKYSELLNDAALYWDLNLNGQEKWKMLNNIIMWIVYYKDQLRGYYSNYLDANYNKEEWDKDNIRKMKLAIFDTVVWNAILKMLPEMIKYLVPQKISNENIKIDENPEQRLKSVHKKLYIRKLHNLFSEAAKKHWDIVDKKVEKIGELNNNFIKYTEKKSKLNDKSSEEEIKEIEELRKAWLMEIKVVNNVVYFSLNKPASVSHSWFPPESFFKYLSRSSNIASSKLNYCVICYHEWDKNSKIKSKSIFVSNIPHSKQDLKDYSLKDKVIQLNELEEKALLQLDVHLGEKIESMEKYVTSENKTRNGKSSKKEVKKLGELVTRKSRLLDKIKQCKLRWLYHWRNGLALISSSYSRLDDVVKILNNWDS